MPSTFLDIGKLRDNPEALYRLCILVELANDCIAWDTESDCYRAFRAVMNSLWSSLPPVVVSDFRDPDTIPDNAPCSQ